MAIGPLDIVQTPVTFALTFILNIFVIYILKSSAYSELKTQNI